MTVLDRLAELVVSTAPGRRARVAVDGPACSGKTLLADRLADVARERRPVVRASIDDFHHPRSHRYRRGEQSALGCYLDTFDHEALRTQLLDPLAPGGSGSYRTRVFDVTNDAPVVQEPTQAPGDALLLFDGVCAQRHELAGCWDLVVLLQVPDDELLRRASVRDVVLLGSIDQVLQRYRTRYLPAQRLYEEQEHPAAHAHVILDNTDPCTPIVRRWAG